MKSLKKIAFVFSLPAVMLLFVTAGCGKDEPAKEPDVVNVEGAMGQAKTEAEKTVDNAKEIVESIEQTTCPIMGKAIDKSIFVEYEGKKVYFCCAGCKDAFEKEPEKYLAKLPQFKKPE